MENWTLILSIMGALAWVPIVAAPIINSLRKIRATLFECRVLTDGKGISVGGSEKSGTIILLSLNIFAKNSDYLPADISAEIKLKNGTISNAELLDFSTLVSYNDDNTKSKFKIPIEMEFNVSRTIYKNSDNIKYVSFLVENASFKQPKDIDTIKIILRLDKFFRKSIRIYSSQFPKFNSSKMLCRYEEAMKDEI